MMWKLSRAEKNIPNKKQLAIITREVLEFTEAVMGMVVIRQGYEAFNNPHYMGILMGSRGIQPGTIAKDPTDSDI